MMGASSGLSADLIEDRNMMAREIFRRLDPERIVSGSIREENGYIRIGGIYDPNWQTEARFPCDRAILAVSAGKSSVPMLKGALSRLKEIGANMIPDSIAVTSYIPKDTEIEGAGILIGNHPYPDETDIKNTESLIERISDLEKGDLIMFLISGGASSVICKPRDGLDVEDLANISDSCMKSGMSIDELNTVRTYISKVKGGGLLGYLRGVECVTLAISDVIGNDPRYIGSGPTIPWIPSRDDVLSLLKKGKVPNFLIYKIKQMGPGSTHEIKCDNLLLADNGLALEKTSGLLHEMGYATVIDENRFSGESRIAGNKLLSKGRKDLFDKSADAFIAGGETTVKVKGGGKGGRNTEMALSLLPEMAEDEYVICIATDGMDGNSASAGGIVSGSMLKDGEISRKSMVDRIRQYLDENDSATLLDEIGGLIKTGPSGVNLNDVFVYINRSDRDPHRFRR